MRILALTIAASALAASTATAQQVAQSGKAAVAAMTPRAAVLEDIERSRQNLIKFVAAAPDSMLTYRPTPGVRTYAEQIEHAAASAAIIASMALKQPRPTLPTDTATYRRNKAALTAYVNASYDAFAALVRDASDEQLLADATFFGSTKPAWRWVAGSLEHATWTLGQTIPYLRANGVKPPAYLPF